MGIPYLTIKHYIVVLKKLQNHLNDSFEYPQHRVWVSHKGNIGRKRQEYSLSSTSSAIKVKGKYERALKVQVYEANPFFYLSYTYIFVSSPHSGYKYNVTSIIYGYRAV